MQHATERVELPGESQEALEGKKKLLQLGPEKQGDPGKGGARSRVHVDVHKNNAFISRRTVKASLNFRVSTSELPGFA